MRVLLQRWRKIHDAYSDDDGWGYINTLSSVVTITVDGRQVNNCGSTVIFAEEGLTPDVNFQMQDIHSTTDGSLGENPLIANIVNKFRNAYGKPVVVVIQSQLGDPICAYSGKDVYWELCDAAGIGLDELGQLPDDLTVSACPKDQQIHLPGALRHDPVPFFPRLFKGVPVAVSIEQLSKQSTANYWTSNNNNTGMPP